MEYQMEQYEIFYSNSRELSPLPVAVEVSPFGLATLNPEDSDTRPNIRAVVFDVYGTLFISGSGDISLGEDISSRVPLLQDHLQQFNITLSPAEVNATLTRCIRENHAKSRALGIEYPEVDIREIWRQTGLTGDLEDRELESFATGYESIVNPVWPMPGLDTVIHSIAEAGLPLGIVSNAQFYTPLMFQAWLGAQPEHLGFHRDLMVWSFQERLGKPSEELYRKLASALALPGEHGRQPISPGETLYVGNDMLKDILPASRCGFMTGLFAGDRRSFRPREDDERCTGLKADYVFRTLKDILQLISG